MNTTSRFLILIPAALMLLGLSACGNKGPLVMPQKPVPIEEQEVVPADDSTPPASEGEGTTPPASDTTEGQDKTEGTDSQPTESTDSNNG
ncbi:MAG: LPS translocon maturation chaperone LptM [Stenotrophomonas sp.]